MALNIVNSSYVEDYIRLTFTSNLYSDNAEEVTKWLTRNLRKWMINTGIEELGLYQTFTRSKAIKHIRSLGDEVPMWLPTSDPKAKYHFFEQNDSDEYVDFVSKINYLLDYLTCEEAPRDLSRLSYNDAHVKCDQYHVALTKRKKIENDDELGIKTIQRYDNGFSWVKILSKDALNYEGSNMGHCVGGSNYVNRVAKGTMTILSLRDPNNTPHVTCEISPGGEIKQFQGNSNTVPVEKYREYIIDLINNGNGGKPYDKISAKWHNGAFKKLCIIKYMEQGKLQYLDVRNLKDGMRVAGDLDLRAMGNIDFPNNMTVLGTLALSDEQETIGENLEVKMNLLLGRNIASLPKSTKVNKKVKVTHSRFDFSNSPKLDYV